MFNRHGCLVNFFQNRFHLLAVVLLLGPVQRTPSCVAADHVSVHVQAALQSEIDLDADKRAKLIEVALREDPNSAEAHWARGDVRMQGKWFSLEDSADEALAQPNLVKYWERRAEAGNTVADQLRLAEFCRSNRLLAQERAHLAAVVALEPNHRDARRRLGQVIADGVWLDRHQLDQQKKRELATFAYLQKQGNRLMALSLSLQDKSMSEERVMKELSEFTNPMVIPGLEYFFSSTGEVGARCAVETAQSFATPDASLSLARHALEFPDESVRTRATNYLKQRDEVSFVPALLGSLQTSVTRIDGVLVDYGSQVVWRQRILFETQDTKRIATLDRIFEFPRRVSGTFKAQWAEGVVARADFDLEAINAAVELKNDKIMRLLSEVTDDHSAKDTVARNTPEDWWNWWNDRIESYPSDEKPVGLRYEQSYEMVSLPTPPQRPRHECLAAGTPIWTESGPVDVELLKVGDLVLAQNQRSGELKFAPVMSTSTRPPELLLRLTVNSETIRATGSHPFWVTGKGWVKARSLKPGMGLHTARGFAVIESVEEEQKPEETFNLIVDDCHSYFVGKNLILSHDNTVREPVVCRIPGLRENGNR